MIRDFIIVTFCITLALSISTSAFAANSTTSTGSDSVMVVGNTYTVAGALKMERCTRPGSVPSQMINVVFLTNLTKDYYEKSNGAPKKIQKLALLPGTGRVDLERLAGLLKPTDKVSVTGRYSSIFYVQLYDATSARGPAEAPYVALTVSSIEVNGHSLTQATSDDEAHLKALASQRVLEEINKRPVVYDGPEARIGSTQLLQDKRLQVEVEYLSGWGHIPMPELAERYLYVVADDSVTLLGHSQAKSMAGE
jgi:hypothetical protein